MKFKWGLAAWVGLMVVVASGAALPEAWKFDQTITIDARGLIKIEVPIETIDHARPALEDLRLFNAQGVEVPYLIERPIQVPAAVRPPRNIHVTLQPEATVAVLETGLTQAVDGLFLESPARDFIKSTLIEGSQDGKAWRRLVEGEPVFRQALGANKLHLSMPAGPWNWLRVTLDDQRSAPIPITGAQIQAASPEPAPEQSIGLQVVDREESPGRTRLMLRLAAGSIVLAGITIETPEPLFTRHVSLCRPCVEENEIRETMLVESTLYRMASDKYPVTSNLTFARDVAVSGKELIMTIENNDSPPLAITAVRGTRRPVYLTCMATEPGLFHLLSGNASCTAPKYDLAAMAHDVSGRWTPSQAGPFVTNTAYRQTAPLPEVAESGAALDTSDWKFRKNVTFSQSGVQQLELDLEILSETSSDFSDLRLVRNGRQISYLIERPVLSRRITPLVKKEAVPKHPSMSRWQLKLPYRSLPLTRLYAQTDAPFFKRDLVLKELVPDERGNMIDVQRARGSWVRVLNQLKSPLSMEIQGSLTTDAIYLETDNGDNPPLELNHLEMEYSVVRLIFKATGTGDVYLYYGNPKARRPQYDIDLAARQMLAELKNKATLGTAEQLKGHRGSIRQIGGATGWIFWGVLGVVVIGLIVVITRLLPKHLDEK